MESENHTDVFPEHLQERLVEIATTLRTTFLPRWQEICDMLMIDDVETFAEDLKALASEFDVTCLLDYSTTLYEQAQSYNIDEIERLLAAFPGYITRFEQN